MLKTTSATIKIAIAPMTIVMNSESTGMDTPLSFARRFEKIGMSSVSTEFVWFPTYKDKSADPATIFITMPKSVPNEHVPFETAQMIFIKDLFDYCMLL